MTPTAFKTKMVAVTTNFATAGKLNRSRARLVMWFSIILAFCLVGLYYKHRQDHYREIDRLLNFPEHHRAKGHVKTISKGTVQGKKQKERQKTIPVQEDVITELTDPGIIQPTLDTMRAEAVSDKLVDVDIDKLTNRQVDMTFHSYLNNINTVCKRAIRMGNIEDGGWEVCDDKSVRPVPPCVIYSFGINNDWSFDDDASSLYKCHVYAFDPTMKEKSHNRSLLVHFFDWGLNGETTTSFAGWQMLTLLDIRRRLNHMTIPLDILKMDIEFSEWPALENMVSTGQLSSIRQLLLEFHFRDHKSNGRAKLKLIQAIEKNGFFKFNVHKNRWCKRIVEGFPVTQSLCYEVHYMRSGV